MRYQEGNGFAPRPVYKGEAARRVRLLAGVGLVLALCAGLQACASDPSYPSLAKITGLDSAMGPDERQKAIQDIQKNDPNAANATAKAAQ
jgi:hypothetical protein